MADGTSRKEPHDYVKPKVIDLGPTAPIFGAVCQPSGNQAVGDCIAGTLAGPGVCTAGTGIAYVFISPPRP